MTQGAFGEIWIHVAKHQVFLSGVRSAARFLSLPRRASSHKVNNLSFPDKTPGGAQFLNTRAVEIVKRLV